MPEISQKTADAISYLNGILSGFRLSPYEIKASIDERGLVLNVIPQEKEARYVIGSQGSIAEDIRNLMRMWSRRHQANVKVLVMGKGMESYFNEFQP